MGGQCPGAPELKGPLRERDNKMKNRKENQKEKEEKKRREQNFSNNQTGALTQYIPMSLCR